MGRSDFGIGIVHGGSADNIVAAADIFSTVANGDLDPQAAQMVYGIALAHIGTVYGNAGAVQHFAKGDMDTPPMPIKCAHVPGTI